MMLQYNTIRKLSAHVVNARRKHPRFVRNSWHFAAVLLEELADVAWEAVKGNKRGVKRELRDVAALIVRWEEEGGK